MRVLEWVLLGSFLPVVVLLLLPRERRLAGWVWAALLPVPVAMLQIAVEGWRAQMMPLYILGVVIFALHLPYFRQEDREPVVRRGGWIGSIAVLLVMGFTLLLAGWLLPVSDLPAPSGTYAVSTVEREIVDETRNRRLMVTIWYPAAEAGENVPLFATPAPIIDGLAEFFGLPPVLLQHLNYVERNASRAAPLARDDAPFPVLVFSHGLSGIRTQNASMLQEMASQGYVVVAMDHPYSSAVTVFPDGEAIYYDLTHFGIAYEGFGVPEAGEVDFDFGDALDDNLFPVWVADHTLVYDRIEAWQADDDLLGGALDLERMGSFGHSFGGATATVICAQDVRCDASVNLDGPLFGAALDDGFDAGKPHLLLAAPSTDDEKLARWERLIENSSALAYWGRLPNSTHYSFTDSQLLSPLIQPENYDPRAGLQVQYRYLREFFGEYVRGDESAVIASIPDTGDVMAWVVVNAGDESSD